MSPTSAMRKVADYRLKTMSFRKIPPYLYGYSQVVQDCTIRMLTLMYDGQYIHHGQLISTHTESLRR
jgi:hypothetical protein